MTNTSIEWTDKTWNPVTGCSKVSPGCAHCYAETVAGRFWATQYPPMLVSTDVGSTARPRDFTDVMTHEDRLTEPLRWRKPARVFVNSMSDLFHEDVPDVFIDRVFAVMALAHQHTFQVLTKRAERMREYLTARAGSAQPWKDAARALGYALEFEGVSLVPFPLSNVWLGVSVENQRFADERIPLLLKTPAAVRFVSAEPLLEAVDISAWLHGHEEHGTPFDGARTVGGCIGWRPPLDWVICGGESGRDARPFDVAWARDLRDQCRAAGVPFFLKQLGSRPGEYKNINSYDGSPGFFGMSLRDRKGGNSAEWQADLRDCRAWPEASV